MAIATTRGATPVDVDPSRNLLDVVWERADAGDHRQALRYHTGDGWRGLTWPELAERVEGIAAGLIHAGVAKGDRVALMSPTRLEWTLADLAILAAGAVTVPLYDTASAEQCAWVLSHSEATVAFAADEDLAKTLDGVRDRAPSLGEVFLFEDGGLDALAARATADDRAGVRTRAAEVRGEDLFSLIYTSGTTGDPKGCLLTHGNMLWTAEQSGIVLQQILKDEDATLLFLPLAHVFARLIQFLCLNANVTVGYARSPDLLSEDLPAFRPTFLLSVPRVFEKVFNRAQRKAQGPRRRVFDFAVRTAVTWSTAIDAGRSPGALTALGHALSDRLVYGKLRAALGGRVHHCVSGGAPLPSYLAHFFNAAGITVLEGYGLTETTAPATVNAPQALRIGTVGKPLPGVEIRIAEDGEVLIRGANVFQGYHRDEAATAEVLSPDGWLATGDIGELDDDGFLRITGRKKDLIVTASGKNVAPSPLEERLQANRLVSQAVVVGDNRPFIAALVTLDPEELEAFAAEHGITGPGTELARHEVVRAEIDRAVAVANAPVSRAESIRQYRILDRQFTLEDEEVTPSMKLRRASIAEHFADEIEALYSRPG